MTTLQTSRLKLIPYCLADVDALYAVMKDERVMRHIAHGAMTREEVTELVERDVKRWQEIGMGWWTIREKSDDRVIGQICLKPVTELPEIEVGFALEPNAWGRGFAEEALTDVLRHGWEDRGLNRVVALVRRENLHSIKLLERCGFAFETELVLRKRTLFLYSIKSQLPISSPSLS